jgi:gamma-glutamyl-gamma-aminobutyrate hydrolase PuuD
VKERRVIAVSQRVDDISTHGERRDALDQRVTLFLREAGLGAVPVPNVMSPQDLAQWLSDINPSGIILSGGNDIGDSPERDMTERALLDHAQGRHLPLLGICRGMQMMGVWGGASLKPVQGHVRTRHMLRGEVTGNVNSYHGFALSDCPANFKVTARSEDGEIEAISHFTLRWQGWMWHPEREDPMAAADIQRVQALFSV